MKKVLFIGTYRQQDSWGREARDYIKAMLTNSNIALSTRPIYYTNMVETNIDNDILKCEHSTYDEYDVLLQYGLTSSFHNSQKAKKNIGIVNVEFSKGESVYNNLILNRLDEIYVSTEPEKKALTNGGITKPVKVIPKPMDLEKIPPLQKSNLIKFPSAIDSSFKFYSRSNHDERSNLHLLITAFHLAFSELDRVSLIIAPSSDASNQSSTIKNNIEKLAQQIKSSLHTNKVFNNEIVFTDNFNQDTIIGIHNSCDCFVNINSGSNFDQETLIASYLGKTPIVLQNTGLDYLVGGEKGGFIVKSENSPVVLGKPPLPEDYDLFNAKYSWRTPIISSLIETMQKVYNMYKNDRKMYQEKQNFGSNQINQYSYSNVGQQLCS
jgi:glycosyltransferase involved in cell wall biosynthesis